MGWIMGNQSRPQEDDGGMSRKGMQEAGRKGWEGERAVRHNGAAAFINPPPQCGREERMERWTQGAREDTARWVNKAAKVKGQLLYRMKGGEISLLLQ